MLLVFLNLHFTFLNLVFPYLNLVFLFLNSEFSFLKLAFIFLNLCLKRCRFQRLWKISINDIKKNSKMRGWEQRHSQAMMRWKEQWWIQAMAKGDRSGK